MTEIHVGYVATLEFFPVSLYNQEQKKNKKQKTQHFQNRFSHTYIYQNAPYYISN